MLKYLHTVLLNMDTCTIKGIRVYLKVDCTEAFASHTNQHVEWNSQTVGNTHPSFLPSSNTIAMSSLSWKSPLSLYSIPVIWFTSFYPMNMKVRVAMLNC